VWIEKKSQLQAKYQAGKYKAGHHRIITKIKRGLVQNQLFKIRAAVRNLHSNPDQIPQVISQLNASIRLRTLSFEWHPAQKAQASALFIRNEWVGLLINTDPGSLAKGLRRSLDKSAPYSSLPPEDALTELSSHAYERK